ncbi:hypothetical protein BKA82DRAFT_4183599 [Pisolithus tinctorius]|nr:hypothetical protein BKA82DRAFT_4183599 [Pisolithus tinctorius]
MSASLSTVLDPIEADVIHPSLVSLMIGHSFTTLLVPLVIALFYFSNKYSRRTPIFILNVAVIALAFFAGIMIDALAIHAILSPTDPWPLALNISIGILGIFQCIFVDLILLLRLISLHPLRHLGLPRFSLLIALPVILKIARITNLIVLTKQMADASRGPQGAEKMAALWMSTPCLKIDWTAQVVDNTYASVAFLWSVRIRLSNRQGITSDIRPTRTSFAMRLRMISRIAATNFIIPTLFSIAQIIIVYLGVNTASINSVVLVNTMITVFGAVFATVWVGKERRQDEADQSAREMKLKVGEGKMNSGSALDWKVATVQSSSVRMEMKSGAPGISDNC